MFGRRNRVKDQPGFRGLSPKTGFGQLAFLRRASRSRSNLIAQEHSFKRERSLRSLMAGDARVSTGVNRRRPPPGR